MSLRAKAKTTGLTLLYSVAFVLLSLGCSRFRSFQKNSKKCVHVVLFAPAKSTPELEGIRGSFVRAVKIKFGKKIRILLQRISKDAAWDNLIKKRLANNPNYVVTLGLPLTSRVEAYNKDRPQLALGVTVDDPLPPSSFVGKAGAEVLGHLLKGKVVHIADIPAGTSLFLNE